MPRDKELKLLQNKDDPVADPTEQQKDFYKRLKIGVFVRDGLEKATGS